MKYVKPVNRSGTLKYPKWVQKMLYELANTSKAAYLFEGWEETLIYSCLQRVMGKIIITDLESPKSAMAYVGCFAFYAGEPDRELVINKPEGFVIMVPQNKAWEACIEECFPTAKKVTRYAIKKDTRFDKAMLRNMVAKMPVGYELKEIDEKTYDLCLQDPVTRDFVSSFESKERFLELGRGMVIMKSGLIVAGASSYTRYNEGIEIEVDGKTPLCEPGSMRSFTTPLRKRQMLWIISKSLCLRFHIHKCLVL